MLAGVAPTTANCCFMYHCPVVLPGPIHTCRENETHTHTTAEYPYNTHVHTACSVTGGSCVISVHASMLALARRMMGAFFSACVSTTGCLLQTYHQLSGEAEVARSFVPASWCITRYTIAMETSMETWLLMSAGTALCSRTCVQPLTPLTVHKSMHILPALRLRCSPWRSRHWKEPWRLLMSTYSDI